MLNYLHHQSFFSTTQNKQKRSINTTYRPIAAPSTFAMVEDGRARTFSQRKGADVNAAVAACPVTCMHRVGFDRLKTLETVRDHGDGRKDHRHFGKNQRKGGWIAKTPLQ